MASYVQPGFMRRGSSFSGGSNGTGAAYMTAYPQQGGESYGPLLMNSAGGGASGGISPYNTATGGAALEPRYLVYDQVDPGPGPGTINNFETATRSTSGGGAGNSANTLPTFFPGLNSPAFTSAMMGPPSPYGTLVGMPAYGYMPYQGYGYTAAAPEAFSAKPTGRSPIALQQLTGAAAAAAAGMAAPVITPGAPIQTTKDLQGPEGCNLFVFHIPNDMTNNDLYSLFCEYGEVISARIMVDKATGRSRGFGFVSYSARASAEDAIKALNGYHIGHKRLKVQHKKEKDRLDRATPTHLRRHSTPAATAAPYFRHAFVGTEQPDAYSAAAAAVPPAAAAAAAEPLQQRPDTLAENAPDSLADALNRQLRLDYSGGGGGGGGATGGSAGAAAVPGAARSGGSGGAASTVPQPVMMRSGGGGGGEGGGSVLQAAYDASAKGFDASSGRAPVAWVEDRPTQRSPPPPGLPVKAAWDQSLSSAAGAAAAATTGAALAQQQQPPPPQQQQQQQQAAAEATG